MSATRALRLVLSAAIVVWCATRADAQRAGPTTTVARTDASASGSGSSRTSERAPTARRVEPPTVAGSGRVYGPTNLEVSYLPLQPSAVQTITLDPVNATLLEYPHLVMRTWLRDQVSFGAEVVGNTVIFSAKKCVQGCATTAFVYIDDGIPTIQPLLLVVDTTRTANVKVQFTDPVGRRVTQTESEIAATLDQRAQAMVATRLEAEVERCLATGFSFRAVNLENAWRDEATGESVGLSLHDVGFSGRCLEQPKLYVRYSVHNATYAAIEAIEWTLTRESAVRPGARTRVPILSDRRAPAAVPPLRTVRGELRIDGTIELAPGEQLVLRARVNGHPIELGSILRAPDAPPPTDPRRPNP